MTMPTFTPLLNRLKGVYTLANGNISVQELIKKFSGIAQLEPKEAALEFATIFDEMMDKIGPKQPHHLKAVEQFLSVFADVAKKDNPALAEQMKQQLEQIKRLNGVAKFEALKKLIIKEQLTQYFAEYWLKFIQSEKANKMDTINEVLKANFDKTFEDNKAAAQQMIYTPEGLLMSRFIRLLKTVFDMSLVMADLKPMFQPESSDGKGPQFYPMPKG